MTADLITAAHQYETSDPALINLLGALADQIERLREEDLQWDKASLVQIIKDRDTERLKRQLAEHERDEAINRLAEFTVWRPIDAAPTNGAKLLLWFPQLGYPVVGPLEAYGYKTGDWKPIHWLPLPPSPADVPAKLQTCQCLFGASGEHYPNCPMRRAEDPRRAE